MEEVLKSHRDQALRILKENKAQSREGIEVLVKGRLAAIAAAAQSDREALSPEQVEALYREVLDLSYMMFSLGYTMAHALPNVPAARR